MLTINKNNALNPIAMQGKRGNTSSTDIPNSLEKRENESLGLILLQSKKHITINDIAASVMRSSSR